MKLSGTTPRPWVKLWKEETGAFAQLPFLTRAVAAELLKYLDDEGRLYCGAKHPADALAFMAGATRGDRRIMRMAVDQLLEVGHLRVRNGWLEAARYGRWQYGREESEPVTSEPLATTSEPSSVNEPATNGDERDTNGHEPSTNVQRTVHEDRAKCPESRDPVRQEKRREEEDQDPPVAPQGADAGAGRLEALREQARRALVRGYAERWKARTGDLWSSAAANDREIRQVATWAVGDGSHDWSARCASVLDGFFADEWASSHWWPWKRLAKDQTRYAGGTQGPQGDPRIASMQAREVELEKQIADAERRGEHGRVEQLHAEVVRVRDERIAALVRARADASGTREGAGADARGQGSSRAVTGLLRAIG